MLRLVSAMALALAASACGGSPEPTTVSAASPAPRYQVLDAGPAGVSAAPRDLDDLGRVLGDVPAAPRSAAYLWDAGSQIRFEDRTLRAMNSTGAMVGDSQGVAFLWRGESATPLAYGTAWSVSENAVVVGEGATGNGKLHAFRWSAGELSDLGTLGGDWSVAYGVNRHGTAVGWAEQANGQVRACVWDGDAATAIDTLGGGWGMAYAVNDDGEITGYSATTGGTDHAFLASPGAPVRDLGSLGGHSIGYDIDERGRVVGESADAGGRIRAVLWEGGTARDLNHLIPPDSGWILVRAKAINDRGQIAGEGEFNGEKRPFLLTPVNAD